MQPIWKAGIEEDATEVEREFTHVGGDTKVCTSYQQGDIEAMVPNRGDYALPL